MAVTHRWTITALECAPTLDGVTDVVTTVHWLRTASVDEATAEIYGTVTLKHTPDAPFVPFAELTEATVIGWVGMALGPKRLAQQEAALAAQLQPVVTSVTRPVPWAVSLEAV